MHYQFYSFVNKSLAFTAPIKVRILIRHTVIFSLILVSSVTSMLTPTSNIALRRVRNVSVGTSTNDLTRSTATLTNQQQQTITLYKDTNFRGLTSTIHFSSCVNLSGPLNDAASSADAHGGCVVICEHSLCRGRCERIEYFSSNLEYVNLNDVVSSVKPC